MYSRYFDDEFLPRIKPLWAAGEEYLAGVDAIETTTNSEGKFRIEAPVGSYLFLSSPFTILDDGVMWCKKIKLSGGESSVSYNQDATITARSAYITENVAHEVEK